MSTKQFALITISGIIATVVATLIVQYFLKKQEESQNQKNAQQDEHLARLYQNLASRPVLWVGRGHRRFH